MSEPHVTVDSYVNAAYIRLTPGVSHRQVVTQAIVDVAEDGTVLGVEVLSWPKPVRKPRP